MITAVISSHYLSEGSIKYRYVYGEFDDVCYNVEEYDRRCEEWEKMSLTEREHWWSEWLEEHELIN